MFHVSSGRCLKCSSPPNSCGPIIIPDDVVALFVAEYRGGALHKRQFQSGNDCSDLHYVSKTKCIVCLCSVPPGIAGNKARRLGSFQYKTYKKMSKIEAH